jgi:hypothetical protein
MEDLFRSYWWLLFPIGWMIAGAWHSLMHYRRHRDTLDLVKSYVDQGKEPPAGLLDRLNGNGVPDGWADSGDRHERRAYRGYYRYRYWSGWPNVVLFGSLCAGFAYAAYGDFYGQSEAFTIVAIVMGGMTLAMLVRTLTTPAPKD